MAADLIGEALGHHQAGRLAEAEALYRRAIAADATNVNAWYLLGLALRLLGRAEEALTALDTATRLAPQALEPLFNLAVAKFSLDRRSEAEDDLRRALTIKADFAEARVLLGQILLDRGDCAGAAAEYQAVLAIAPEHKAAAINLGLALQRVGRADDAVAAFRKAAGLVPDNADVMRCLAGLLVDKGGGAEAVAAAERATTLAPRDAAAWYVLGAACQTVTELDRAAEALARAVELDPNYVDAATRLAHLNANRCDWRDGGKAARQLIEISQSRPVWPWAVATLPASAAEQRRAAEIWAAAKTTRRATRKPARRILPGERIRIGYLSADFHQHATAWLVVELFERHDRGRVEVIGLSLGPDDGSALRRRLSAAFDRFVDLAEMTDADAARRIEEMGLDVLVDLKGWTQNARPEILARRPAAVQVAWLAYPGTMGADWIDYVLADPVVLPQALEPYFSEAVARLPDSYQPTDTHRLVAARSPTRRDLGLPEAGFVFCCFNNVYKITQPIFEIWMRLLHRIPGSVLWLLAPYDFPKPRLRREAAARGVDPARLIFAEALPQDLHLARLARADLFLDTLPVNAHTTASDALWMGLPLITCPGETFAGRVAASVLTAAGFPDLVATSLSDYEALALRLAQDPAELAEIRGRLSAARGKTPLFDAARLARHIEDAFAIMNARAAAGEDPRSFDVPARD